MSGLHIQHKRNFHAIRWTIALVVFAALAVYTYFGIRWYNTGELSPLPLPVAATDTSLSEATLTDEQIQKHTAASTQPRYVEIPKLSGTQSRIAKVGLTSRTMLDTPRHIDDAGWYVKSAEPGSEVGAVLLTTHGSGASRPGVFTKLSTLVAGDQITIERGDGKRFTYEVFDVRTKTLDWVIKVGMKEMMASAEPDKEGLSIISNTGKWIPKQKVFDHKVLVRATLVK